MDSFGITDKGKIRQENQDSFLIERLDEIDCLVAAVCDGMGGARAGNIASDIAVKAFMAYVRERLLGGRGKKPDYAAILTQACAIANSRVFSVSCSDSKYTGMGTTIVAALIAESEVYILNVGDSRAYCIGKKRVTQLTKDHSLVQELVDSGSLSATEAREHPRKNVITRALGVDASVQCDIFTPKLGKGERLLLCSDGLSNMLPDDDILAISKENTDTITLGRSLMEEALKRGARDNVTIVTIIK